MLCCNFLGEALPRPLHLLPLLHFCTVALWHYCSSPLILLFYRTVKPERPDAFIQVFTSDINFFQIRLSQSLFRAVVKIADLIDIHSHHFTRYTVSSQGSVPDIAMPASMGVPYSGPLPSIPVSPSITVRSGQTSSAISARLRFVYLYP